MKVERIWHRLFFADMYYSLIEDTPDDDVFRNMMNNPEEYSALTIEEQQKYVYVPDNYSVDGLTETLIEAVRTDLALAFMNAMYRDYDYNFCNCNDIDELWYLMSCHMLFSYPLEIEDMNYWFYDKIEWEIADSLIRLGEIDDEWNIISKEEKTAIPEPDGNKYEYYFTHGGLYDIAHEIEEYIDNKDFETFLDYYEWMNTKDVYVDPYEFETTTVKEGQQWIIDSDWYKGGRIYSADYLRENNVPEEFIKANYMKWMPDTIFVTKETDDDAEESYEIPVLNRKNFMKITHCESENG